MLCHWQASSCSPKYAVEELQCNECEASCSSSPKKWRHLPRLFIDAAPFYASLAENENENGDFLLFHTSVLPNAKHLAAVLIETALHGGKDGKRYIQAIIQSHGHLGHVSHDEYNQASTPIPTRQMHRRLTERWTNILGIQAFT